jgi:4-amino-4-deoxy-L-arabinose transferase-like glycosyltransferase
MAMESSDEVDERWRPIYWMTCGALALVGGVAWFALILAGRADFPARGLPLILTVIGLGSVIYGAVLLVRRGLRKKRMREQAGGAGLNDVN